MTDQVARLLNSLRVIARDNQREITKRGDVPAVVTQQTDHRYSLFSRLLARERYVWRLSRGRDCETDIAFRSQRFDLPGEDIFESSVVGNAGEHATVCR